MKKIILLILSVLLISPIFAETLKAGISETKVPKGFFGVWRVTSTIVETNNPSIFNAKTVDMWALSGYGNKLILQNPLTGANSEIELKDKDLNGKTLKFTREKEKMRGNIKYKNIEIPIITLGEERFEGYDTYILETWKNNVLLEKNVVKYKVIGEKISGD